MTTAGEGGMVTTNSADLWTAMWSFKDHGKSYDEIYHRKHTPGFQWLHDSFGTNWRMTEVQSAIGRLQLRKLPDWVRARRENAALLGAHFAQIPGLRVTTPPTHIGHSYYKYYAFVSSEALGAGWNRDRIIAAIASLGTPCFSGSCSEIYREKAFPVEWRPSARLPIARELGRTSIMFLVHPTLTYGDIARTCDATSWIMREAVR